MDILSLELRKLGLKEKEVGVYLAGLGFGASSVQNIAKKAGIARATTYEIIRILQEKGLFAQATQNKKRVFIAQSPEKILGMLRLQKREVEEKEREFIRIIAALESRVFGQRGGVQVFKGKDGLKILEEQLLFSGCPAFVVFTSENSSSEKKRREGMYEKIRKRLGRFSVQEKSASRLEGTLFLGDKAIFISRKQQEGYVIDSPLVVKALKNLL